MLAKKAVNCMLAKKAVNGILAKKKRLTASKKKQLTLTNIQWTKKKTGNNLITGLSNHKANFTLILAQVSGFQNRHGMVNPTKTKKQKRNQECECQNFKKESKRAKPRQSNKKLKQLTCFTRFELGNSNWFARYFLPTNFHGEAFVDAHNECPDPLDNVWRIWKGLQSQGSQSIEHLHKTNISVTQVWKHRKEHYQTQQYKNEN